MHSERDKRLYRAAAACFIVGKCAKNFSRSQIGKKSVHKKSDIPRATDRVLSLSLSLSLSATTQRSIQTHKRSKRESREEKDMKKKKPPLLREEEQRVAKTTTTLLFQFLNPIDSELHRLSTKIEAECFPLLREREIPIAENEDEEDNNREDFDGVKKKKDATADGVVRLYLVSIVLLMLCFCI